MTIIDINKSPGVLGFAQSAYSVTASGGSATIAITRTNGSQVPVTVGYITRDGTATNHIDYTSVTNTINFGIGVTSNAFSIPIINHTSTQPDKTVTLQLYSPSGGATLGLTNAVLTIINSTYTSGHVSFTTATFATNENSGVATITVNRLGGSTGTLAVKVITSDGSAKNGVNYLGSTNQLQWVNNDATPRNISIPVIDDGIVTSNLTVNLRLTNATINTTVQHQSSGA